MTSDRSLVPLAIVSQVAAPFDVASGSLHHGQGGFVDSSCTRWAAMPLYAFCVDRQVDVIILMVFVVFGWVHAFVVSHFPFLLNYVTPAIFWMPDL